MHLPDANMNAVANDDEEDASQPVPSQFVIGSGITGGSHVMKAHTATMPMKIQSPLSHQLLSEASSCEIIPRREIPKGEQNK